MKGSACGPSEAPEGTAAKRRRRVRARGGGAPRAVNKDASARFRFIMERAEEAEELDV